VEAVKSRTVSKARYVNSLSLWGGGRTSSGGERVDAAPLELVQGSQHALVGAHFSGVTRRRSSSSLGRWNPSFMTHHIWVPPSDAGPL